MNITLNNADINQALLDHIKHLGIDFNASDSTVNITAGRGDNGCSAVIALSTVTQPKPVTISLPPTSKGEVEITEKTTGEDVYTGDTPEDEIF